MAVALSLGGSGGEAPGDSSRRFGEHRAQRQRSVEAVVVSELVLMGFSDERAAEAARAAMVTNPPEEDALEVALTFLAESPRDEDDEDDEEVSAAVAASMEQMSGTAEDGAGSGGGGGGMAEELACVTLV